MTAYAIAASAASWLVLAGLVHCSFSSGQTPVAAITTVASWVVTWCNLTVITIWPWASIYNRLTAVVLLTSTPAVAATTAWAIATVAAVTPGAARALAKHRV